MSASLNEAVIVGDAESLEDCMRRGHAAERAQRAQPFEVGVFKGNHCARSNEGCERVMVIGKKGKAVHVIVKVCRKPDVLCDNLRGLLDDIAAVLFELGESPLKICYTMQFTE